MAGALSRQSSKAEIRRLVLAARAARSEADRDAARAGLLAQAGLVPELRAAATVAAYAATDDEPDSRPLVDWLHRSGVRVLLPLLRTDDDLDWAEYAPGSWRAGRFGIQEPATPPAGRDAVRQASVIICPGVAGDLAGGRLGRGGGSYDRVLRRADPSSLRCMLLYDDEVLADVPTDSHDEPVDLLITPLRSLRTSRRRP